MSSTKQDRFEETVKRWQEAERGTGGLKRVRFHDFDDLPAERKKELLTEAGPTILTADGIETCVVTTVEQFFALIPQERIQWGKLCVRIDGRLFKEVE